MKRTLDIVLCIFLIFSTVLATVSIPNAGEEPMPEVTLIVTNVNDLQNMTKDLSADYELAGDIDAKPTAIWNWSVDHFEGFLPIGTSSDPFTGTFNGHGFNVSGLFINRTSDDNIGLFGYSSDTARISNVTLNNYNISGYNNVGALVGYSAGDVFNSTTLGVIKYGHNQVGGLIGRNQGGNVTDCYAHGKVYGSNVRSGGLLGINNNGLVSRCWSTADVYGYNQAGGLVGRNTLGTIEDSYASGNAIADLRSAAGLVANNSGQITNCYSIGLVLSPVKSGGLIANNTGTVISSYWDNETSDKKTSEGGEGKNTHEMQQQSTYVGWNFFNIWGIKENRTYPYFLTYGYFNRTYLNLTLILGSPTNTSVTVSVLAYRELDIYFEYGLAPIRYTDETGHYILKSGFPLEVNITGLQPDTLYRYRMRYRQNGTNAPYETRREHSFRTQRSTGSNFTFTITSDSHFGETLRYNKTLYERTLRKIKQDKPDFHLDLGDTFISEKGPSDNYTEILQKYIHHRNLFSIPAESIPLFHANGNWDGEKGWYLDGTPNNLAINASLARTRFYPFPKPTPDGFYTGDSTIHEFIGLREDFYAWEWGNALFMVLHPYWFTTTEPPTSGDKWDWTLGLEQYNWLRQTLENSTAKFKFVFTHHIHGLTRGAVGQARYYEWGGLNRNGSWGFDANRPGWGKPVHQTMVDNNVSIVFQGHDHVYAMQVLDGIVYQTVPQPSNVTYSSGYMDYYQSGVLFNNSGYLRVNVTDENVTVNYVRIFLKKDENATRKTGMISHSYKYPLVDTVAPTITHIPVLTKNVSETINITAVIKDDISIVHSAYLNYTDTNGINHNVSMSNWGVNWTYEIPGQHVVGILYYFIWTRDPGDNQNRTINYQVQINDVNPPAIYHTSLDSVFLDDLINITANITDGGSINTVYLNYTDVHSVNQNITMSQSNDQWYFVIPGQNITGLVNYFIWANDTSDNFNRTPFFNINVVISPDAPSTHDSGPPQIIHTPTTSAFVEETIRISAQVMDDVAVAFVHLNFVDVGLAGHNVTMVQNGDIWSFDIPGQALDSVVTYQIIASDTSDNISMTPVYTIDIVDNLKPIIFHMPASTANISEVIQIIANVTDNINVTSAYLNFTDTLGNNYNVSCNRHNGLWKCQIPAQTDVGRVEYFLWASDATGNYAMTQVYTIFIVEAEPPSILHASPTGVDVPVKTSITIVFSEPMNVTSVDTTVQITPDATILHNWSNNNQTLEMIPSDALSYETIYNVTVGTTAKDINGNGLVSAYSWEFITEVVEVSDTGGSYMWWLLLILAIVAISITLYFLKSRRE